MKKLICMVLSILVIVATLGCWGTALAAEELTISIQQVQAKPGELVQVALGINNNPGIISVKVKVEYNSSLLTLEQAEGAHFKGTTFGPVTANPFTVNWMNGLQGDNTTNGTLAVFTFRVSSAITRETTLPLTLQVNPNDVFNNDIQLQPFSLINGSVTVAPETPWVDTTPTDTTPTDTTPTDTPTPVEKRHLGDVNRDDKVDARDALWVLQTAVGKRKLDAFSARLADCDGDGVIDAKDALQILKYAVRKAPGFEDQWITL